MQEVKKIGLRETDMPVIRVFTETTPPTKMSSGKNLGVYRRGTKNAATQKKITGKNMYKIKKKSKKNVTNIQPNARLKKSNKPSILKALEPEMVEVYGIACQHLCLTFDEFKGRFDGVINPEQELSLYARHAEFLKKFKEAFEYTTFAQEGEAFRFTLRCDVKPISEAWNEANLEVLTEEQREWLLEAYTDFVRLRA